MRMNMSGTRKYFGTDGIRGAFGQPPMTPEFVWRCGRAAAEHFAAGHAAPLVLVGRDTRASGFVLEEALADGLRAGGAMARRLGVLPTAAVALNTVRMQASAGVMISASHNPADDNGVKFFGPDGFKLDDATEEKLERLIDATPVPPDVFAPEAADFSARTEAVEHYFSALRESLPSDFTLSGLRLVVDAAHGAAWATTPAFLRELGAEVEVMGDHPDGKNINEGCGSLFPELLGQRIRSCPGSVGICHDGDADRLILVDEGGDVLDGDEILAIAAIHALRRGELPTRTLVATVMSNLGLDEAVAAAGGRVVRTPVGDRHVLQAMREGGHLLGGEPSGHLLFLRHSPAGDGLLAALQILRVVRETGRPLRDLRQVMRKYPQRLEAMRVREKIPLASLPAVQEVIQCVEREMAGRGRVLLRYSGTEPKARLLLEHAEAAPLEEWSQRILRALKEALG